MLWRKLPGKRFAYKGNMKPSNGEVNPKGGTITFHSPDGVFSTGVENEGST